MRSVRWFFLMALALVLCGSARAQCVAGGPFSDVPRGHPAYRWVLRLQRAGVPWSLPDGACFDRPILTRYEFAVGVEMLSTRITEWEKKGAPWRGQKGKSPVGKLASEFRRELEMLGSRPEQLDDQVQRFERLWKRPKASSLVVKGR